MGESKRKRDSFRAMVANAERCVYCLNKPDRIEHMPPLLLFNNRSRPQGLEFPSCKECNHGTRGADAAAAFYSRISREPDDGFWSTTAGQGLIHTLRRDAKQVYDEAYAAKPQQVLVPTAGGILRKSIMMRADGPALRRHLNVFAGKLAMALYHHHTGSYLPSGGLAQTAWYLNSGLSVDQANAMLKMMPGSGELRQGKFMVREQFAYRYNSDNRSIVTALIGLHSNLHVFFLASSEPEKFGLPVPDALDPVSSSIARPGRLSAMLASKTTSTT